MVPNARRACAASAPDKTSPSEAFLKTIKKGKARSVYIIYLNAMCERVHNMLECHVRVCVCVTSLCLCLFYTCTEIYVHMSIHKHIHTHTHIHTRAHTHTHTHNAAMLCRSPHSAGGVLSRGHSLVINAEP